MTLTLERAKHLIRVEDNRLYWVFNYQRPDLIGQEAGYLGSDYWRVTIDSHTYYRSEIIWLFHYGKLPERTLDHKDTTKLNDDIGNLRLATKAQNLANAKMNCRNTSGFKGVSFCNFTGRWRASIRINGTEKNLGRYDTPEEAHQAWYDAAVTAFGEEFVRAA